MMVAAFDVVLTKVSATRQAMQASWFALCADELANALLPRERLCSSMLLSPRLLVMYSFCYFYSPAIYGAIACN